MNVLDTIIDPGYFEYEPGTVWLVTGEDNELVFETEPSGPTLVLGEEIEFHGSLIVCLHRFQSSDLVSAMWLTECGIVYETFPRVGKTKLGFDNSHRSYGLVARIA